MRTARVLLALPGLAALVWGLVLFGQFVLPLGPRGIAASAWLLGGPIVHDALVAPLVAIAGLVLAKVVSPAWRGPLLTGAAVSGVLALLSVPLLWRTYGAGPSPGLHDSDIVPGLLSALAAVWLLVFAAGAWNTLRTRRAAARG